MNAQQLQNAIANAPENPRNTPPLDLVGWWHTDSSGLLYVCAACANRIMARGVSLNPSQPLWADQDTSAGQCVTCQQE